MCHSKAYLLYHMLEGERCSNGEIGKSL